MDHRIKFSYTNVHSITVSNKYSNRRHFQSRSNFGEENVYRLEEFEMNILKMEQS